MSRYILALDQGTTSSRAILFDRSGNIIQMAQQEFTQHYPQPGWVEHNPNELFDSQAVVAAKCLRQAGITGSEVAAVGIAYASVQRFLAPQPLEALGTGIVVATAAGAVNFIAARVMLRAAREYDNIVLEADAKHLLTDVWTSAGLVAALSVMLFAPPSWQILDPVLGFIMAVNIVWTGISLVRRSVAGLMDEGLPPSEVESIIAAIGQTAGEGTQYHALRTRRAGSVRFVDFHLLVPGAMTVQHSHDLCCSVEERIRTALPGAQITIHVEPREDHASFDGWKVGGLCDRRCQPEEK